MIKYREAVWFIQCDVAGCMSTFVPGTGSETDPRVIRKLAKVEGWISRGNERLRVFDACIKHPNRVGMVN